MFVRTNDRLLDFDVAEDWIKVLFDWGHGPSRVVLLGMGPQYVAFSFL